jgi:hypothetical protein
LLFQKTRIIPFKQGTVQPGDAFEDIAFKLGFEIVKPVCRVSALHFFVKSISPMAFWQFR